MTAQNKTGAQKAAAKIAPVRLKYDYWNPTRQKAGTVIYLPTQDAKQLVADGKAERADAWPGED